MLTDEQLKAIREDQFATHGEELWFGDTCWGQTSDAVQELEKRLSGSERRVAMVESAWHDTREENEVLRKLLFSTEPIRISDEFKKRITEVSFITAAQVSGIPSDQQVAMLLRSPSLVLSRQTAERLFKLAAYLEVGLKDMFHGFQGSSKG